jgi:UPF0755 protein
MFKKFSEKKINRKDYSQVNWWVFSWGEKKNIKKKKGFLYKLVMIFFIWILLTWIFIYKSYENFKNNVLVEDWIIIEVLEWENVTDFANKLGLNENYLKFYLKENKIDLKLFTWNFKIDPNSDIKEILKALKNPIILGEVNITILEWWNIYDIDEYLANKGFILSGEYINYVNNPEKIEKLTEFFPFIKGLNTLEWFLYPDTYKIEIGNFKINEFVIKQLENFENRVYKNILSWLENNKVIDLINLASIVEKEEKNTTAKPIVAWILKKRLENWWMIWADITVCYPHELTAEECKMVISKYINEKSEYNTRTMQWLPKTPIWNPSFETVNATLNYEETEYWFYLHDSNTWKIYYGRNNEEHEQNKRLYLK